MVLIGLLPLSFAFVITYLEERQAIRDAIGRDFRQIAIEAAGKVELQVMQGVSEARQLATIPILRGTVIDSNRSYTGRSEEHTSELQSRLHLVCRLLLEK